jgi:hypothetical protein
LNTKLAGDRGRIARWQHALVVTGLEVAAGRHRDELDRGGPAGQHGRDHRRHLVEAHQGPRPRVGEHVGELALLVHRVHRDRDATGLPGGEHADDEGGVVLGEQREPVTGIEAALLQGRREGVRRRVDLGHRQHAVEVADRVLLRPAAYGVGDHVEEVGELGLDVVGLAVAVAREPGTCGVGRFAHGAASRGSRCRAARARTPGSISPGAGA